ncbi:MAG TPA: indole-3-glycerol phosphate synthase TrpC, partial [Solirubrobacteraceae bacterium]|nr:indole-3-glycerol phosphate synthase TrpC [Solirubrobacteraceae bacterium]
MSAEGGASVATADGGTVLDRILAETRVQIEQRKRGVSLGELEAQAAEARAAVAMDAMVDRLKLGPASSSPSRSSISGGRFHRALARPGISVIAEFKRRSPSAGRLRKPEPDIAETVRAYERGGASALSVLTEGPNFEGSLADIVAARDACGLPILRKDFIVDPYQLHEACLAGAEAVLLIVAALDDAELASLHELGLSLGLDVLVEVHDGEELARAARIGARLIGVNNRDLRDFSVDVGRTERLLGEVPAGTTVVSESGISTAQQLER